MTIRSWPRRKRSLVSALAAERDLSQTVLRSLRDGVVVFDSAGRIEQVSPRWCEITGYAAEEVIGRAAPFPWWPPEEVDRRMVTWLATLAAPGVFEVANQLVRPDGVRVSVHVIATPVFESTSALRMVVATFRDCTERNRIEVERRRMAEQLDQFFELSRDLLCIADTDGYFKRLNPAWQEVLGHSLDELLSRPYIEFVHPDDVQRTLAECKGLTEPGAAVLAFENRYRCRDGSFRWLNWNATAFVEEGLVYAVARDITALREGDEARAWLAAIVDSTEDAVIGKSLDGTIVSWNRAAERMYGYRTEEAIGRPIGLILASGDDEADEILNRVSHGEPVRYHDTIRRRRDGTPVHVALSISPIRDGRGDIIGAASIATDITERKHRERELAKARDDALAATQLKSQFVAMVSHEIRTPMNGVIGLTRLLLDTPLEPAQRRYVEAIGGSGRALLTIINDILDFSKIESGKIELLETDLNLRALVEEVVAVAAELARDKDIEVIGYYPPTLPFVVRGDGGRLRQALLNLVGNAVKFTERGHVLVMTEPGPAPGGVTFTVADTGVGIAPEDAERLFEPFHQVDGATDRQFGGTGLGLTICRKLVELMGGRLDLASEPGRGTRFFFTLPLPLAEQEPATGDRTAPVRALVGRRVLVADDNDTSIRLMVDHVRAWGMTPTTAGDGTAALTHLRAAARDGRPFEVAILDQHMPNLGGLEVVDAVRTDPDIPDLAVIVLTTGVYRADRVAILAGAVDVLAKPIGPSQLYNCLLRLFDPTAEDELRWATEGRPATDLAERGRVLVAEDNDINQLVAVGTLQALGYHADIANDGFEAVHLATSRRYDAVLMDCQMPGMDGFAATAEIRRREGPDRHTPVIAMTAGALAQDRDRCRVAGMDDFIAKPVDPDQLGTTLARWIAGAIRIGELRVDDLRPLRESISRRLALLRNDQPATAEDFASRMVRSFTSRVPDHLAALAMAVAAGDADAVLRQAHDMVGVSGNLGAADLAALSNELQTLARAGDLGPAPALALVDAMREEYLRVCRALDDLP